MGHFRHGLTYIMSILVINIILNNFYQLKGLNYPCSFCLRKTESYSFSSVLSHSHELSWPSAAPRRVGGAVRARPPAMAPTD
jgi:hypothetical protein